MAAFVVGGPRASAALPPQQAADCANAPRLSARAFHKVQRVARSTARLEAQATSNRVTIAEALAYRALPFLA